MNLQVSFTAPIEVATAHVENQCSKAKWILQLPGGYHNRCGLQNFPIDEQLSTIQIHLCARTSGAYFLRCFFSDLFFFTLRDTAL